MEHFPSLKYWLEVTPLAHLAALLLGTTLGVMGVEMKKYPRLYTYPVMALIGVALFLGAWSSANQARDSAELGAAVGALQKEITGHGNYAFVHSRGGKKTKDGFLMFLQGIGYTPSVNIEIYRLDDAGQKTLFARSRERADLQDENINFNTPLPNGRWELNFRSRFNNWDQILELKENNSVLRQVIKVVPRGGGTPLFQDTKHLPIVELDYVPR